MNERIEIKDDAPAQTDQNAGGPFGGALGGYLMFLEADWIRIPSCQFVKNRMLHKPLPSAANSTMPVVHCESLALAFLDREAIAILADDRSIIHSGQFTAGLAVIVKEAEEKDVADNRD